MSFYNDRVETKNANKPHLYGQLRPDNFEPFPKNPHIAQIFTQMGRSEELGTGLRNVYKYSKEYSGNGDVEFLEEDVFISRVPLIANISINNTDKVTENVGVNVGVNNLYEIIKNNPGLNSKQLQQYFNVTDRTLERWLKQLREGGKIEFKGAPKTGGYFIEGSSVYI